MRLLPRGVDPALGAIVAEGFLSRLSFGIAGVALSFYALHLGMKLTEIGLLSAIPVAGSLAVKPATGWVADRFGLKKSFVGAIFLRSMVALLFAFAFTPFQLLAVRAFYGVSQGVRDPALNALLAERGGKKSIASAFAWYATAKNVAGNAGAALGGFLLGPLDLDFSTVFLLIFLLSMLPLVVVIFGVREAVDPGSEDGGSRSEKPSEKQPETPEARRARAGALVREYAFVREFGLTAMDEARPARKDGILPVGTWLYPVPARSDVPGKADGAKKALKADGGKPQRAIATSTIVSYVGLGVLVSGTAQMLKGNVLTAVGVQLAHLTPGEVGVISLVSGGVSLAAGPVFGWLSDNASRRLVLSVRGIANTCSSLVFVAIPNFVGFAIGDSIDEIGKAAFKPAWGALMAEVAGLDRSRRARTMGYLSVAEDIGEFCGPLVFSSLAALWTIPAAFGVRVLLAAATEAYASRLHKPQETREPVGKLKAIEVAPNRRV